MSDDEHYKELHSQAEVNDIEVGEEPSTAGLSADWHREIRDFLDYIKLIRQFYQTGEIRHSDWDMIPD